jgi:DNA-binding CsgD family transcriptional regulator
METNQREPAHAAAEPSSAAPEDSCLPSRSVGVSARPATFVEGMDWSAVALLLAERAQIPVVLIGENGDLLHVAPAAQKALGCRGDLIGKNWIELQTSDQDAFHARLLIARALTGATHHFDVKVPAPQGTCVVTFESYPIGHGVGRGILLFVQSVAPAASDSSVRDFDYEVKKVSTGDFRLQSLRRRRRLPSTADGQCFRVLHDRSSPCERCPVVALAKPGDVHASAHRCNDVEIEVTTARLLENGTAAVSVRRVSKTIFTALLRARLDELADRARLSQREREVLDLLVDGQTFEEIGEKLGITARTVKYHQGNLLSKLGADSRSDLVRLLF